MVIINFLFLLTEGNDFGIIFWVMVIIGGPDIKDIGASKIFFVVIQSSTVITTYSDGYLFRDLSRSLGMFVSTFLDWKVLTVLVWDIVALLLWDIATVGILDTIAVLIWYLGALSIFFLLSSVFSNWGALRSIVPFTSCWIFNPNLLSWGWFFPMLLTSLFVLCKAF